MSQPASARVRIQTQSHLSMRNFAVKVKFSQSPKFYLNKISPHIYPGYISYLPIASGQPTPTLAPTRGSEAVSNMETRVVRVPGKKPFGYFQSATGSSPLDCWQANHHNTEAMAALEEAAANLRNKEIPVAFPTETVYGLGADATRSASVRGIYAAKNRPSDNPLIVHVCDLEMLRDLLGEKEIPSIYEPLIERFWPGPLTILLPNAEPPRLALEVTAGLKTFGARMPSSPLALSLIKLTGRPLAAPSANASTKPSPTTAQHVMHDLDGRIELILDGGPCQVGVESTVVDGLSEPPAVLRPGGVSMDELRSCPGWGTVVKGYKDHSEEGNAAPRAPGMKYKHYSPKATVVLYEASYQEGSDGIVASDIRAAFAMANRSSNGTNGTNGKASRRIGIIRTQRWKQAAGLKSRELKLAASSRSTSDADTQGSTSLYDVLEGDLIDSDGHVSGRILDISLGVDPKGVAQGLFAALRELDQRCADTIFVDGIKVESDIAEAVMNRLRKAASEIRA